MGQHNGTIDKITEHGDQFIIVARLEIAPSEIVVLCLGRVGGQHIPQYILFAGEVSQILVKPYGPVARCRNFVALQIQELVGRNIFRKLVAVAISHKHCRENYAVEHYVVLAYEVDYACLGIFPVFLPAVGQQLLGIGNVADGSVEPHVEHLAFGAFHGHGYTPVEVAAHGAGLQTQVEPRFALAVHVGLPFLMAFENPFAQRFLPAVQRQIPMGGLLHGHGRGSEARVGIDEVGGVERRAASLALVAVGAIAAAVGAGTGHVAVGEELAGLLVVGLHGGLHLKLSCVVEMTEEFAGCARMYVGGCA